MMVRLTARLTAAVVLASVAALLGGCAQTIGATRFPEPSPAFVPKKEYAVPADTVWKTVQNVLENNRIGIAAANRDDGRITTDYIQGQSQMNALGMLGVLSTRYKYLIRVSPRGNVTSINVLGTLESSGNAPGGGPVGGAWHDISNDNKPIVTKLETWLYEQIEASLARR